MAASKKTKPPEVLGEFESMLTRLKLTAMRDQLDTLLDQAARAELNLCEALTMLCTAEVASKDERRLLLHGAQAHCTAVGPRLGILLPILLPKGRKAKRVSSS